MDSRWPIHTVVFDLDDTLFSESEFVISGFRAVGRWLQENKQLTGFAGEAERLFAAGHRGQVFDEALARLGAAAEPSLVQQLVAVYREHAPKLTLLADAREILAWAEKKFRLALISDGFLAVQERKLSALGIKERFAVVILTDALGRAFWKPSPEAFQRVMRQMPGPADGFVYVADNPRKDFIAPKMLGWKTVRIRRRGGEHACYEAALAEAAQAEIKDMGELASLIATAAP